MVAHRMRVGAMFGSCVRSRRGAESLSVVVCLCEMGDSE